MKEKDAALCMRADLDKLEGFLTSQVKLSRHGSIGEVESLAAKTGSLVERMGSSDVLELPEFRAQCQRLKKLYKELCLSLASRKASTSCELKKVHKGRQVIGVYRDNIR